MATTDVNTPVILNSDGRLVGSPTDPTPLEQAWVNEQVALPGISNVAHMPARWFTTAYGKTLHPPTRALMSSGVQSDVGMGGPNDWMTTVTNVEPQWGAIQNLEIEVNGRSMSYRDAMLAVNIAERNGLMNARAPLPPDTCVPGGR